MVDLMMAVAAVVTGLMAVLSDQMCQHFFKLVERDAVIAVHLDHLSQHHLHLLVLHLLLHQSLHFLYVHCHALQIV